MLKHTWLLLPCQWSKNKIPWLAGAFTLQPINHAKQATAMYFSSRPSHHVQVCGVWSETEQFPVYSSDGKTSHHRKLSLAFPLTTDTLRSDRIQVAVTLLLQPMTCTHPTVLCTLVVSSLYCPCTFSPAAVTVSLCRRDRRQDRRTSSITPSLGSLSVEGTFPPSCMDHRLVSLAEAQFQTLKPPAAAPMQQG